MSSLALATPGAQWKQASTSTDEEKRREVSRDFGFPYESAYGIQVDLMRAVFETIEAGKIGVFESPTGTGKSLSLICAAATWREQDAQRAMRGHMQTTGNNGNAEPGWVIQHNMERMQRELQRHEEELKARIAAARRKLVQRAIAARRDEARDQRKRIKVQDEDEADSDSDDEFLVEYSSTADAGPSSDTGSYLSPAVRALMAKTGSHIPRARSGHEPEDDEPQTTPKIIYASRTHSQISQFIGELKKTRFGRGMDVTSVDGQDDWHDNHGEMLRTTSLGSRRQMCIHSGVQKIGARRGVEAMNEKCLDLIKAKSKDGGHRCQHLPSNDESGQLRMQDFTDASYAAVRDIEDLVELGRSLKTCPYFGARKSARQAHVVTVPYNLLLNKTARAALNLELKDSVVIIDEAHNLIDTILATHSITISSDQIARCIAGADVYLTRFGSRLKGVNEVNLKKLIKLLRGLAEYSEASQSQVRERDARTGKHAPETATTTSAFLKRIGGNVDQLNLFELETWLRESKVLHKIVGYADKQEQKRQEAEGKDRRSSGTSAMHAIESLLLALVNRDHDGRIFVARIKTAKDPAKNVTYVKYQLLNPAEVFVDIAKDARSVILAGGTMEPFSDFETQLFTGCAKDRLTRFSCGHIIPPSNLMASVVCKGMTGKPLEFKYEARGNTAMLDEVTGCLINYCNVIPSGIVVFVPSYSFLDQLILRWKASGAMSRIEAKKKIFFEPKETAEVDSVLQAYTAAIDRPEPGRTGSVILAVVGAKLSEGINFSDQLARAVVMIGMPFANAANEELAERMRYVKTLPANSKPGYDAGQELYINLCMKAVNQSIGRAIRHRNDYAALIFLDARYGRSDIRARLPGWIRDSVKVHETFGPSMVALGSFFRSKRV